MSDDLSKKLVGKQLRNGWKIERERSSLPSATGCKHSVACIAHNSDGRQAFVKVLDTTVDRAMPDPLADLKLRIDTFLYERNLVEKCAAHRMSRVVRSIESGEVEDDDSLNPIYYLMFELAEGDLREQADLNKRFDVAFRFRVLHRTAIGLEQMHWAQIAHQDLKPSNIVVFPKDETKIADLGHAHDRKIVRPGKDLAIAADPAYAPPEQLYGRKPTEWAVRRLAPDLYLLGSLAVFMFTGVGMTAQLSGQLRPEHHWDVWLGTYEDVLPYVREAYEAVMEEFSESIDLVEPDELVTLVRYLSEPDPLLRGHPRNVDGHGSQFGLRRFVSRFNVLASHAEFALRSKLTS